MATNSESTPPDTRRAGSDSARRILEILFAFTENHPRRTARELSEAVGVPAPSVHRYVALLRELGLIAEARRGLYQLTPRVFPLTRAAEAANSILDIARPHLSKLSIELDETVALVQQIGDQPVCVARYESARTLRASFQPGQPMPALRGASAKIHLSGMSVGQREAYVARMGAQLAPTPGVEWTEEELREAREQGWTTSSQEVNEGIWAVAAAIEFGGKMVASISVACPDFRMSAEDRDTVIRRARETAEAIARDLERGVGPEARTGST